MAFVVAPSRNKTLQLAWAMHKAAQRAEKKAHTEEIPNPHAAHGKRPSTSAKPAVKKPEERKPAPSNNAPPPRALGGKTRR